METTKIDIKKIAQNTGQIAGLPANPRQWKKADVERLAKSIEETPELLEARPIIVMPHDGKYIVLGGNLRLAALKHLGWKDVPVYVLPEDTPIDKQKEIVIKDNGSFGEWDYDELANQWDDLPLADWGVSVWDTEQEDISADEIERKKREFEERMKAGEISEEDEEYQAFLEKFQLKKTTDDCYTPPVVYEAVAKWVAETYKVEEVNFVRPFYPGGDYQRENYKPQDIVVDNPPFSILAEILNFYKERQIRFFLFAPALTLFSSSSSSSCALPCGVAITYENGASVSTSFLTNLEDPAIRLRSAPSLYKAVKEANDVNLKGLRKELPKYSYDHHIITAPFVGALSRLGIAFQVPVVECEPISQLESQKASGKAIYGKGYIVSDRVFAEREKAEREKAEREKAEREKAEREKAEREKAERWELSPKEMAIVKRLNNYGK